MRMTTYSCLVVAALAAWQAVAVTTPVWQKMPGKMSFIAAAADGTVIGSAGGLVQTWDGLTWKPLKPDSRALLGPADTYTEFRPFAGNANTIWLLKLATKDAQSGSLYQLANSTWQPVPGAAHALSMSGDGSKVYALNGGIVYEYCLCGQPGQTPVYRWITRSATLGFGQAFSAFSMTGPRMWAVGSSSDKPVYFSKAISDSWV